MSAHDPAERDELREYYTRAIACANLLPPPGDTEMHKAAELILSLLADSERLKVEVAKLQAELDKYIEYLRGAVRVVPAKGGCADVG